MFRQILNILSFPQTKMRFENLSFPKVSLLQLLIPKLDECVCRKKKKFQIVAVEKVTIFLIGTVDYSFVKIFFRIRAEHLISNFDFVVSRKVLQCIKGGLWKVRFYCTS